MADPTYDEIVASKVSTPTYDQLTSDKVPTYDQIASYSEALKGAQAGLNAIQGPGSIIGAANFAIADTLQKSQEADTQQADLQNFIKPAVQSDSMQESGGGPSSDYLQQKAYTQARSDQYGGLENAPMVHIPKPTGSGVGAGIVRGLANTAEGLTSGKNVAFMIALGGAPAIAQKVVSGAFAADMALHLPATVAAASQAKTPGEAAQLWTEATLSAAMTIAATAHAAGRSGLAMSEKQRAEFDASRKAIAQAPTELLQAAVHDPKIGESIGPDAQQIIIAELQRRATNLAPKSTAAAEEAASVLDTNKPDASPTIAPAKQEAVLSEKALADAESALSESDAATPSPALSDTPAPEQPPSGAGVASPEPPVAAPAAPESTPKPASATPATAAGEPYPKTNLTPEAEAILSAIEKGGAAPAFISKNLEKIARENGVTITRQMRPQDVIDALRAKRDTPTPQSQETPPASPPVEPTSAPTPEPSASSGETYGIAQRVREQRTAAGKVGEVSPGQGISAPDSIEHGRALLSSGTDPVEVMQRFEETKQISHDDIAVVRAYGEALAREASAAERIYGTDSPQYKSARDAVTAWDTRSKAMQTEWHKIGMAQQAETDLDTGSVTEMERSFSRQHNRPMTDSERSHAAKVAEESRTKDETIADLEKKLTEVVSGQPTVDVSGMLDQVMRDIEAAKKAKRAGTGLVEFADSMAEAARERMRKRGSFARTSALLDPMDLLDSASIGASYILKGVGNLAQFTAKMVEVLGEGVREHIPAIFDASKKQAQIIKESHKASRTGKTKAKVVAEAKVDATTEGELTPSVARDIVQHVVESGVTGERAIMDAAHELATEAFPDITPREFETTFARYGEKYRTTPNPEPIAKQVRKLYSLTQMKLAIDDLVKKGEAEKSGAQRDKMDADVRRRKKELNEALNKYAKDSGPTEGQLASRNEAKKTALRNRIIDIDNELRTGQKPPKNTPVPYDTEVEQLQAERDAMVEKLKEVHAEKNPGMTPEDRYNSAQLKRVERELADLRARSAAGNYGPKPKGTHPAKSPELLRSEAELEAERQKFSDARDLASGKLPKDLPGLRTHFSSRASGKFTLPEIGAIWNRARAYIDSGTTDFRKISEGVATDLGLTPKEVVDALSQNRTVRKMSNDLYRQMYERRKIKQNAKLWIESANKPAWQRAIRSVTNYPRAIAILGHANAMVTHAGQNAFRPGAWKAWGRNMALNYRFLGNKALHEAQMQALENHPLYNLALRSKLRVAPGMIEDYASYGKFLGTLGEAGNRAMDSLKTFRMDMFASELEKFAPEIRQDVAPLLAQFINHISGFGDIGHGTHATVMREVMFAPSLEASRWANVVGDPIKYAKVRANWKNATPAEKAMTKYYAGQQAKLAGVMVTALLANQALQSATGQEDGVNLTDPSRSDWMKFKWDSHTYDITGNVTSPVKFIGTMLKDVLTESQRGEGHLERMGKDSLRYVRGKVDPKYGIAADVLDNQNAIGQAVPWTDEVRKKQRQISWSEYAWSHAPIPVAEAAREIYDSMVENGTDEVTAHDLIGGIMAGVIGAFGVKEGKTPKEPSRTPKARFSRD